MKRENIKNRLLIWSTRWIGGIAKRNPELARAVEMSFYGAVLGALGLVIWQPELALSTFLSLFLGGIVSALKKRARDKQEAITK